MGSFQLNLGATELYRVLLQPFISHVKCSVARDRSVCARARRAPLRLINIHSFEVVVTVAMGYPLIHPLSTLLTVQSHLFVP